MSAPIDLMSFTSAAMAARGALVEREGDRALVVCPPALAAAWDVMEELTLCSQADDAGMPIRFGSPLVEKCAEWARELVPCICTKLDLQAPRTGQAEALAGRFVVRNGVHELSGFDSGTAIYSLFWFAWTAECDDRYDGITQVALAESDCASPDPTLALLLQSPAATESELAPPTVSMAEWLGSHAAKTAAAMLAGQLAPILASLDHRKTRDHQRISAYFEQLSHDAATLRGRTRLDGDALAAKMTHYERERDRKLADLDERFGLRVTMRPAALLRAEVPTLFVRLRVRRRKDERELVLRLPAGATRLDRPACEACGAAVEQPAVCDAKLHLLCGSCIPEARGRLTCPACATTLRTRRL